MLWLKRQRFQYNKDLKEQTTNRVCRSMEKITAGVCEALGGEYQLCYPAGVSPTINDEFCAKIAESAARELFETKV